MSKTNATHIQKHPRFFWEFLEHFKFFDFDQAIARKNNYSETPKPPRLIQNWLSSTKLAITSEILGILRPNFLHLYFLKYGTYRPASCCIDSVWGLSTTFPLQFLLSAAFGAIWRGNTIYSFWPSGVAQRLYKHSGSSIPQRILWFWLWQVEGGQYLLAEGLGNQIELLQLIMPKLQPLNF